MTQKSQLLNYHNTPNSMKLNKNINKHNWLLILKISIQLALKTNKFEIKIFFSFCFPHQYINKILTSFECLLPTTICGHSN